MYTVLHGTHNATYSFQSILPLFHLLECQGTLSQTVYPQYYIISSIGRLILNSLRFLFNTFEIRVYQQNVIVSVLRFKLEDVLVTSPEAAGQQHTDTTVL